MREKSVIYTPFVHYFHEKYLFYIENPFLSGKVEIHNLQDKTQIEPEKTGLQVKNN